MNRGRCFYLQNIVGDTHSIKSTDFMECFSADSVSGFALEEINCFVRAGKLSLYGAANLVDQQSMALSKFGCGFAIFNVITSKAIELDQDEGGLRLLPAFMSGSEPVQVVLNNLDTFSGSLFLHVTYKDALISEVNELTQAGVDMRMEQVIEHITVSDLQGTLHSEQINITDAIAVLRHIVGLDVLSGGLYHSADVNNDGAVNITDAIAILRHIVGLQVINQINLVSEDGNKITSVSGDQLTLQLHLNGDVVHSFPSSDLIRSSALVQPEVLTLEWAENTPLNLQVGVTFDQGSEPNYQLMGADTDWFELDIQNGSVSLISELNFEAASDADGDNVYSISVLSTRGGDQFVRDITLSLVNVDESVSASPEKNGAAVYQLQQSSGSTIVDNLLIGSKWGAKLGQGVDITYSFYDSMSTFAYTTYERGAALGDHVKQIVRDCLGDVSSYTLMSFTEVDETTSQVGDVRLGYQAGDPYAAAWGPDYWPTDSYGGDVYFDLGYYEEWESAKSGDGFFSTIGHEIGHALGLEHPHSQGAYSDQVLFGTNDDIGQQPRDGSPYTIMSYAAYEGGSNGIHLPQHPSTFMIDDVAALQYLYGVNRHTNNTDTRYGEDFLTAEMPFEVTIWDAGGTDWLDWSHLASSASVDLAEGQLSFFGERISDAKDADIAYMVAGEGVLGIADGVVIENAYGGLGTDAISGNASNNTLFGGVGFNVRDELWGGLGQDVFICALNQGADQLENADRVMDFTVGEDVIGLALGLSNDDITVSGGTGYYQGSTLLSTEQETLFILEGIDVGIAGDLQLAQVDLIIA